MYQIEVVTPPAAEPVTVAALKTQLRLNTTAEDGLLSGYITSARIMFETMTQTCVTATGLRQHVATLTPGDGKPLYCARGPVSEVTAVKYYDEADTLQTLTGWTFDRAGMPCPVYLQSGDYPAANTARQFPAYVEYTAGYADADSVPAAITTAITLLAAHFFANRSATSETSIAVVPLGFAAIASMYSMNLSGDWGM